MKKRWIGLFLVICLVVGMLPTAVMATGSGYTSYKVLSGSPGANLSSGFYTITSDTVIDARDTVGLSGLVVNKGATVVLYIPTGLTLEVYGGFADYKNGSAGGNAQTESNRSGAGGGATAAGAGAGIEVPETSTLIITGGGTVKAQGGYAQAGGSGGKGGMGWIWEDIDTYAYSGAGGGGGSGGGGAGAGIGGKGGTGGSGGSGGNSVSQKPTNHGDFHVSGKAGGNGSAGGKGQSMGIVYILGDVTVSANGGKDYGMGGSAGGYSPSHYLILYEFPKNRRFSVSTGGGGGGGGTGLHAADIGSGGGGGSGGAGGGSGALTCDSDTYVFFSGYGGAGGKGFYTGESGLSGLITTGTGYGERGGAGGSSASAGSSGSHGTLYKNSSATIDGVVASTSGSAVTHSALQHEITLHTNYGDDSVDDKTAVSTQTFYETYKNEYNAETPVSVTELASRPGYSFAGWYTSPNPLSDSEKILNADGTLYKQTIAENNNNQSLLSQESIGDYFVKDGKWFALNDIVLYARWVKDCELTFVAAKTDAACQEQNYDAYYSCEECGKLYADAEGTKQILTIPYTGYGAHRGGEATCSDRAQCQHCGMEYGGLNGSNHKDDTVWMQTTTTHRKCYDCCGAEVEAKAPHAWEAGICTVCGYEMQVLMGDVNGDGIVNAQDALAVLEHAANIKIITEEKSKVAADITEDGVINAADALYILEIAAGIRK